MSSPSSSSSTGEQFRPPLTMYQFDQLYSLENGELIQSGGYASVVCGVRRADRTPVAIKTIFLGKRTEWDVGANGRPIPREVACLQKAAQVPGVIRMLDWVAVNNGPQYVIVMERPEHAEDLMEFYNRAPGEFDPQLAQSLLRQLATTLLGCHQAGVLHCDLKEENLLIDRETKSLKLIDFNLAHYLQPGKVYSKFVGTENCVPPEVITSGQYDGQQAEIWAIGVLFYRLVTGNEHPFGGVEKITSGQLVLGGKQLSPQFEDLLRKCLAINPRDRISLQDILQHPWVSQLSSAVESATEGGDNLQG
ncbi:Ran GDP/GTP exchange factor [Tyrophagus putrescentiae]|nr:Ran GDP/GTP exchange factor [Tyrophagus putrescentiae]